MRYIRCFLTMLILLLLLVNIEINAYAINTGFSTEYLSKEREDSILTNIKISLLTEEPKNKSIVCFDVNENGMIALGYSGSDTVEIGIYTSNGVFQYGYQFNSYGSFGVEWDEDNINIYTVRSDLLVSVDATGEIIGFLSVPSTRENSKYWRDSILCTKRIINNTEYTIKNDMGIFNLFTVSYSQLTITDANGEETIIYDIHTFHLARTIVICIAVFIFVCVVTLGVIKELSRKGLTIKNDKHN